MNPFLEQPRLWEMVHSNVINGIQEALAPQVRPKYAVHLEHRISIHEPSGDDRGVAFGRADVSIAEARRPESMPSRSAAVATAPVQGTLSTGVDVLDVGYVEIRDRAGDRVVTVIELLSPSNKVRGADREQFLGKRWTLLRGHVNYVEIDLLRGGPRLPVEGLPECDYYALVSRPESRPTVDLWPWRLREPMPVLPIPLDANESTAGLDLKAVLDRVYDTRYYGDFVYQSAPSPPLSDADSAWAAPFLPAA
jgi:hypothetical protein